jgi:zinc protease
MGFLRSLSFVLAAAGLLVSAPADAQTAPPPSQVGTVEGVTEYRLANGMQVLLYPDSSKPTVTVYVTY